MNIKVIHDTNYHFDHPVYLEPQVIRLMPKSNTGTELISFELAVDPKPVGLRKILDEENNYIHFSWFNGLTSELHIRSSCVVRVLPYNPFGYIIYPYEFQHLPLEYSVAQQVQLAGTLIADPISDSLKSYGQKLKEKSANHTITFLTMLTAQLHTDFKVIHREVGVPHLPDETFALKEGSCRDLTWMQIHLLRSMGVAARFVSGYYYIDISEFELHAWIEVFIPGAGWLGFDPSYGIAAGNTHFPIAVAAHYDDTMPVTGTFRGKSSSILNTNITMEAS